jgi:hypothetical protein
MAAADLLDFRILLPAKWIELDLDPQTRTSSFRTIVAQRGASALDQGDTADELVSVLETAAAQALALGAVYAAFYSDVLGEDRPVTASLLVSIVRGTGAPLPEGANASTMVSALRDVYASGGETQVHELSASPAVWVKSRGEAPTPGGAIVPVLNIRYLVPVPDLDRIVVMQFSTPNLALAEPFAELFDAIAGSLAWT